MADRHSVTYHCPIDMGADAQPLAWTAKCCCGEQSDRDPGHDGTMVTARTWADKHRRKHNEPANPQPPAIVTAPDAPDPTPDSWDAFLRGVTRGG
jgi:hypothetical protein